MYQGSMFLDKKEDEWLVWINDDGGDDPTNLSKGEETEVEIHYKKKTSTTHATVEIIWAGTSKKGNTGAIGRIIEEEQDPDGYPEGDIPF